MTNKELANLIFPNIDKTLEDYKEMYTMMFPQQEEVEEDEVEVEEEEMVGLDDEVVDETAEKPEDEE